MSIPDYQTIMLPLLRLTSDGSKHRISEALGDLARTFDLSADEVAERTPTGKQTVLSNRANWAKTYLSQAGLLEQPRRAYFRITARGREVLKDNPRKIDIDFLNKFPEFLDFKTRLRSGKASDTQSAAESVSRLDPVIGAATPDEILRETVKDLERSLSSDLLQRILSAPPVFFENLIVTLLLGMGYGGSREDAGRAIGKSGDGGIDGVIDQDPLGLDRVYVQAKRL
jgi:restriction system protein